VTVGDLVVGVILGKFVSPTLVGLDVGVLDGVEVGLKAKQLYPEPYPQLGPIQV